MTPPTTKERGRPRSFTDEDVFHAVTAIVQDAGVTGLTLAAVAKVIGCTGQALNVRFGSRKGLLIAYSDWAIERDAERFRQVQAEYASPLAALRARFQMPLQGREEELSNSAGHIRILSVVTEAQLDPDFAERMRTRALTFEKRLTVLIQAAINAEELTVPDAAAFAHFLQLLTIGGSTLWGITGQGSVLDEIRSVVDMALTPYLAPGVSLDS